MKKILFSIILLFSLVITGCTYTTNQNIEKNIETKEITRKDELELEGFINDYFYRRQIKDSILFSDFEAYGSVISKSIVIYIYPKSIFSQARSNDVTEMIEEGIKSTLLNFPDFDWAKEYSIDIVIK